MRTAWLALVLVSGYVGCVVSGLEVGRGSSGAGPSTAGSHATAGATATRGGSDNGAAGEPPSGGTTAHGGVATSAGNNTGGNSSAGTAGSAVSGDAGSGGAPEPSDCPKGAGQICHELLVLDYDRKVVTYIDEFVSQTAGAVVWSKAVETAGVLGAPRSLELVDNAKAKDGKAVLVGLVDGFGELDLTNGEVLVHVITALSGVTAARRLPDGNTALGMNDGIHVYSSAGTEITTVTLPGAASPPFGFKRDPTDGHYWYVKYNFVYHTTETGKLVWNRMFNAGTNLTSVLWRDGGGAYVSTGDGASVIEVDTTGIVNTVGGRLNFSFLENAASFSRLPNGHFLIANRVISGPADAPRVVELTADNKLVWQWGNLTLAPQVNDLYVIR